MSNRSRLLISLSFVQILWGQSLSATVRIVAPGEGETVSQLRPLQAKVVRETKAEREKYFTDDSLSASLRKEGSKPQPVTFKWTGGKGPWHVVVRREPDGKVFCDTTVSSQQLSLVSLEIARAWTWTVEGVDGRATGSFKTEDLAPRIIAELPNARDIGGRIGLGGRRIRQGMVFRSAGLNHNAPTEYYKDADEVIALDKTGKLKEMGHDGRSLHRRLKKGEKLDARTLKKAKLVKRSSFAPGKERFTPGEKAVILARYGIRSDVDLRTDRECFGMTGSPLGSSVKWFHCSYSGYGGLNSSAGTNATRQVFKVFLDPANYPIDFHCIAGADRTGTFAFLLEALLGVDENNLYLDYTFTGFAGNVTTREKRAKIEQCADFLRKHPGETWAEKAAAYFRNLGFTQAEIDTVRNILLEK